MAHRRGSFRGSRVPESLRRKKTWASFSEGGLSSMGVTLFVTAVAGPSDSLQVAFIDSGTASAIVEGTLMRIRGSVNIPKSQGTVNAATQISLAFGIGFVTDEAATAGAVPNPATAVGADWDGWLFYRSNTAAPLDANATVMDSKAMRKWDGGQSLALVFGVSQNTGSTVTGTQSMDIFARGLFLLP